jgi:hypothetical protein
MLRRIRDPRRRFQPAERGAVAEGSKNDPRGGAEFRCTAARSWRLYFFS